MARPTPLLSAALSPAVCLAPHDTRAGAGGGPVTELVTFRLLPGTDAAEFLTAVRRAETPLLAQPGFLRRSLSQDGAGVWTDHLEWADLASAKAAARAMMKLPEFRTFMAFIDPSGMVMRHATTAAQMGN
jgi:hypothetical protein